MPASAAARRHPRPAGLLLAFASLLGLAGCAVSSGFKGPGWDARAGVTAPGDGPVIVALTEAVLKPGLQTRSVFMAETRRVEATLRGQAGLIGWSLRMEPLGRRLWTMTVWTDEDSLRAFVRGDAHRAAVRAARDTLDGATFARARVDRGDLPVDWDRALAILTKEGYVYN